MTRDADQAIEGSSLMPLPHPYIVPGGRFKEIYYWDSYFTILGLAADGKVAMIENMVKNFAYLIETVGHIPNGNRTYFKTRSQPPFFALMVDLLASLKGEDVLTTYLPYLQKEYEFWMRSTAERVVEINGYRLNRYWDSSNEPRQESYAEDVELADAGKEIFRHLRAACESGWDFSCRWFMDGDDLKATRTLDILPVDLNCLLYFLEATIAKAYEKSQEEFFASAYNRLANRRQKAINTLFFNEQIGGYTDYWWIKGEVSDQLTLAMLFPLFFKIATPEMAASVAKVVEKDFLKSGWGRHYFGQFRTAMGCSQWLGTPAMDNGQRFGQLRLHRLSKNHSHPMARPQPKSV